MNEKEKKDNINFPTVNVDSMSVESIEGIKDAIVDIINTELYSFAQQNKISIQDNFRVSIRYLRFRANDILDIYYNKSLSPNEKNERINQVISEIYSQIFVLMDQRKQIKVIR